ncbi:MAG: response regulator [Verrucomicrobia bacterium]|nr:response regulator [Verrucomicrobiota bacterium]
MKSAEYALRAEFSGHRILVIEDDTLLRKQLQAYLQKHGAVVETCANLSSARHRWQESVWDTVLLDVNLPDGDGLEFLQALDVPEGCAVVVMTATGSAHTVVQAMRAGASDYIAKPFDYEELPVVFARIHRDRCLQRIDRYRTQSGGDCGLIWSGLSAVWRDQLEAVAAIGKNRQAQVLPPVLLLGETGTGKTTIARWLHTTGRAAKVPWLK